MTIHEWILASPGSDDDRAVRQAMFVRDRIGKALYPTVCPREVPIEVVGEHRSKSAVLPVCLAEFERGVDAVGVHAHRQAVTVRFRSNWHNWAISVESSTPIDDLDGWGLFDESDVYYLSPCTMDGFEKGQVFGPYAANRQRFSCLIWGPDEAFWMFCRLIRGK